MGDLGKMGVRNTKAYAPWPTHAILLLYVVPPQIVRGEAFKALDPRSGLCFVRVRRVICFFLAGV